MGIRNRPSQQARTTGRLSVLGAVLAWDVLAGAAAMYLSITLRYLFEPVGAPPGTVEWTATGLFAVCSAGVFIATGLPRTLWRHTGFPEAAQVVQAVIAAHLVFLPVFFMITRLADFPRSSLLISGPLMVAAMLAPRLAATAWRSGDIRALFRLEDRTLPAAVLVGPLPKLAEVLRDQTRRETGPVFRIKALIDTSGSAPGRALLGVPVAGDVDALQSAVERVKAVEAGRQVRIVIAEPDPDTGLIAACAKVAGRTGSALSRARSADGARAFTAVEASDLLSRAPRTLSRTGARALLKGKRVLVTGAGGAIGSELVRQAAALGPARLVLFDSCEANLYEIDRELCGLDAKPDWRPVLGDVRDIVRLRDVFAEEQPQIVLHAAALKHVPLMEDNAAETVLTNVFGTRNVVVAADETGAELVALVSTDKAVDPANVMGASKRAAELYMSAANGQVGPRLCAVRFGNVLASTGSVVPLFERQIEAGGPVTVTHPETTRYFMTVEEAAGLVLEAGARTLLDAPGEASQGGALYLLDMGEPVPIARLARQLIRLRGKEPGRDIEVRYIGLRRGETLHESLTHAFETTRPTPTEGVLRVGGPRPDAAALDVALNHLREAADARDEAAVRKRLEQIIALGWPKDVVSVGGRLSAG